jgi:hypothetical protein
MSNVGHGVLGFRGGLRDYIDLIQDAQVAKHMAFELRPSLQVTRWALFSGTTYSANVDKTYGSVKRDVVGVRTNDVPALTRVETLALCQATANSYYYEVDAVGAGELWNQEGLLWNQAGLLWSQFVKLYVNLGGDDPRNTVVMAEFGFYAANHSVTHPSMGPNKLSNGDLEDWSSSFVVAHRVNDRFDFEEGGVSRVAFLTPGTYSAATLATEVETRVNAAGVWPAELTPSLWLTAESLLASLANGAPVTAWADQSGNGRNFVQGTAARQPVFETGSLNGYPSIVLDGDDVLTATALLSDVVDGNGRCNFFAVILPDATGAGTFQRVVGDGNSRIQIGYDYTSTGSIVCRNYDGSDDHATKAAPEGSWQNVGLAHDASNVSAFVNDGDSAAATNTATGATADLTGALRIGSATTGFKGKIAEIIIFAGALSEENRRRVTRYLVQKYGLTDATTAPAWTNTYTVTYSAVTDKFTTARSAGGATLSLPFSTGPNASLSVHGTLGYSSVDKTGSTSYESDDGSAVPASWTKGGTGGSAQLESVHVRSGSASATLTASGSGINRWLDQAITLVPGKVYRACGSYRVAPGAGPTTALRFYVSDGSTNYLGTDGRCVVTALASVPTVGPTGGEWRRFVFDFIAPASFATPHLLARVESASGESITAQVDGLEVRRVWRYEAFEPRVGSSAIPPTSQGSNDVFFGGRQIGEGAVTLINADAALDLAVSELDWLGAEVRAYAYGSFPDGQEILFDDAPRAFTGIVQETPAGDSEIEFPLQDAQAFIHLELPRPVYNAFVLLDLDQRFESRPRAMLFGTKTRIPPVRLEMSGEYGVYEVAHTESAPNGIKAIDAVYAYADESAATETDTARRVTLSGGTDYSTDLATGKITILRDVGITVIEAGVNDRLDFNDGSVRAAVLTPGPYTRAGLVAHLQTRMNAVSSGITCSYSDSTHLVTISKSSGTLQLLLGSGANKERSIFSDAGFTGDTNLTGSLSYAADTVLFDDVDLDHVLRVDAKGYKDDSSGTYTGTANALIELGPDIVRCLWARWLHQDLALIDETTFAAARTSCPQPLGIYLGERMTVGSILEAIERSCMADLTIDGYGRVYFVAYTTETDAAAPALYDQDYLEFESNRTSRDVYPSVEVQYDENPETSEFRVRTRDDETVIGRFRRLEAKAFETFLTVGNDAQRRARNLSMLAAAAPIVISLRTRGKLLRRRIGQQVFLTRDRVVHRGGAIDAESFRIVQLEHDWLTGETSATVVELVEV